MSGLCLCTSDLVNTEFNHKQTQQHKGLMGNFLPNQATRTMSILAYTLFCVDYQTVQFLKALRGTVVLPRGASHGHR